MQKVHNSVDEICITAIEKWISGFTLTDHCEVDLYKWEDMHRVDNSFYKLKL
ncbi:hypothetical protein H8S20_04415 [Clostridium sp. NSJ-6]|uniref:Uncharacterized protein n=1 Tax=Clostridium hominis TaxID=2763036 RepID=A0ABR7D9R7_9CLOT|nr:hypothetical protein [Clostridium hominis]MBC5628134.1 hypothetical protein [Clostridium hominis]